MKLDTFGYIDAHNHLMVEFGGDYKLDKDFMKVTLDAADALNIAQLCVAVAYPGKFSHSPEAFTAANNAIIEAMNISDRFWGLCYTNPGFTDAALDEIKRCVTGHGMVGLKCYYEYVISDPVWNPILELAGELKVPAHMHCGKLQGDTLARQPNCSNAEHMIIAAKRFPDTTFVQAHIGGGGDWEWNLRLLEDSPDNLYIDIGGSNMDAGIVRKTVDAVGADRVLFATDLAYETCVGKLLDAGLSEAERRKVGRENLLRIIKDTPGRKNI